MNNAYMLYNINIEMDNPYIQIDRGCCKDTTEKPNKLKKIYLKCIGIYTLLRVLYV